MGLGWDWGRGRGRGLGEGSQGLAEGSCPTACCARTACCAQRHAAPNGMLRLDSQCKTPNATEATFCKEINRIHGKGDFLVPVRVHRMRDEEGFIVRHYAGEGQV